MRVLEQRLGRDAAPCSGTCRRARSPAPRRPSSARVARHEWPPRSRPFRRRSPRHRMRLPTPAPLRVKDGRASRRPWDTPAAPRPACPTRINGRTPGENSQLWIACRHMASAVRRPIGVDTAAHAAIPSPMRCALVKMSPHDGSRPEDHPHRRRRRGHARHADGDSETRLSRAVGVVGRGRPVTPASDAGRPDAARRPVARHRRPRTAAAGARAARRGRGHHDLGDHRRRDGRPGDEARRLSLHHEGIRLRRPAGAGAQCERTPGPAQPRRVADRAGAGPGRGVRHRARARR